LINLKSMRRTRNIYGWILVLPALASTTLFIFYPVFYSIVMSMTDWTGFSFKNLNFVGLENYRWLFTEAPHYWESLQVSFKFAFISTIIQTLIGYLLAFVLYNMTPKTQNFYKTVLYMPVVLPAAVVSVMWGFIYSPEYGLLNQFLRLIGLDSYTQLWVSDHRFALGSVIVANTWRYVGITMILYFVAMCAVPKEVVESAKIDGANKFRILFKIFLPLTWETTQVNLILSLIGGMKSFDLFYLLTGGEAGTKVVSITIYQTAFVGFRFSKAITMSIILFLIVTSLTLLSHRLTKRKNLD